MAKPIAKTSFDMASVKHRFNSFQVDRFNRLIILQVHLSDFGTSNWKQYLTKA